MIRKTVWSALMLAGLISAPRSLLSSPPIPTDVADYTSLTFGTPPGVAAFEFNGNGQVEQLSRITDAVNAGRIAIGPDGASNFVGQRLEVIRSFIPNFEVGACTRNLS